MELEGLATQGAAGAALGAATAAAVKFLKNLLKISIIFLKKPLQLLFLQKKRDHSIIRMT